MRNLWHLHNRKLDLPLQYKHPGVNPPPGSKHPVVLLVRLRQVRRLGVVRAVVDVPLRLETTCQLAAAVTNMSFTHAELLRLRVSRRVVVHRVGVQDDDGALGDELTLVREVLRRDVGCAQPERVVGPLNLLDDGMAVYIPELIRILAY